MKLAWFSRNVSCELALFAQALCPGAILQMDQVIITLKDIELWSSNIQEHTLLSLAVLPVKCVISPVSRVLSALCQEFQRQEYQTSQTTALECQASSPEEGRLTLLNQAVTWVCSSMHPLTRVIHNKCQPASPHKEDILSPYTGIQRAGLTVITWTCSILQLKHVLKPLNQPLPYPNPPLALTTLEIFTSLSKDVLSLSQTFWPLKCAIKAIQSIHHTVLPYNHDEVSAHINIEPSCQASMSLNLASIKQIFKPISQSLSFINPYEAASSITTISSPSKNVPSPSHNNVPFSCNVIAGTVFQSLLQFVSQQNDNISVSPKLSAQPPQRISSINIRAKIRQSLSSLNPFEVVPSIENLQSPCQDTAPSSVNYVPLSYTAMARHAFQSLLQTVSPRNNDMVFTKPSTAHIQQTHQTLSSLSHIRASIRHSLSHIHPFESVQTVKHVQSPDHRLPLACQNDVPLNYSMTVKHAFQFLLQCISWEDQDVVSAKLSIQPPQQSMSSLDHIPLPLAYVLKPICSTFLSLNPFAVSSSANIVPVVVQDEPVPMYVDVLRNVIQSLTKIVSPYIVDFVPPSRNMHSLIESASSSRYAIVLNYACQSLKQAVSPYISDAVESKYTSLPKTPAAQAISHDTTPLRYILQSLQQAFSPYSQSKSSSLIQKEPLNGSAMSLSYMYLLVKNVFQPLCQALSSKIPFLGPPNVRHTKTVIKTVSPVSYPTLWNLVTQSIGQVVSLYTSRSVSSKHSSLKMNQTTSTQSCANIPLTHASQMIWQTCLRVKDATGSLASSIQCLYQDILPHTRSVVPVHAVRDPCTQVVLQENGHEAPLKSRMQTVRQAVVASSNAVMQMVSGLLPFKDVILPLRHAYKPVVRSISLSRHIVLPLSRTLLPLRSTLLPLSQIILELRHTILPLSHAILPLSKTALILCRALAPLRRALGYLSHVLLPVIHSAVLLSKAVPAPLRLRTIQLSEGIIALLNKVTVPLVTTSIFLSCRTIVAFTHRVVKPGSQIVTLLICAAMPWTDRFISLLIPVLSQLKRNIEPSDHTLHKLKEFGQLLKTGNSLLLNQVDKVLQNLPAPYTVQRLEHIILPTKHVVFCLNETFLSLTNVGFALRHTIVPLIHAIPSMIEVIPALVDVIPPMSQAILPLGELILPLGYGVGVLGHAILSMINSLLPMTTCTSSYGILANNAPALASLFKHAFLHKRTATYGI